MTGSRGRIAAWHLNRWHRCSSAVLHKDICAAGCMRCRSSEKLRTWSAVIVSHSQQAVLPRVCQTTQGFVERMPAPPECVTPTHKWCIVLSLLLRRSTTGMSFMKKISRQRICLCSCTAYAVHLTLYCPSSAIINNKIYGFCRVRTGDLHGVSMT